MTTPARTQLIHLATARNYARQGDKPLFDMYLKKAEEAKPLTPEQYAKMLNVWISNNTDWRAYAPAELYAPEFRPPAS